MRLVHFLVPCVVLAGCGDDGGRARTLSNTRAKVCHSKMPSKPLGSLTKQRPRFLLALSLSGIKPPPVRMSLQAPRSGSFTVPARCLRS